MGGQKVAAAVPTMGGMGKFLKAKPKCLSCNSAFAKTDGDAFCATCEAKGTENERTVREACITKARALRTEMEELRCHCQKWCSLPPGPFPELPFGVVNETEAKDAREKCLNANCHVIFRRVRVARDLKSAANALVRLKVTDCQWW